MITKTEINIWLCLIIILLHLSAYELWFKQILHEIDSVREMFKLPVSIIVLGNENDLLFEISLELDLENSSLQYILNQAQETFVYQTKNKLFD